MRISDSAKVLFVHIPKNGGSTMDSIFDEEAADSRQLGELRRHVPYRGMLRAEPALADYWSFGFVRNPWDRMVSWYSMMSGFFTSVEAGKPTAIRKLEQFPKVWAPVRPFVKDFETFVFEAPQALTRFGKPQIDWLEAKGGRRRVDFIGRVENYQADLDVVRDRLGLAPAERVERRNRSSHSHYRDYYTPETRAEVARIFARDIEEFRYSFDEG